MVSRVKFSTTNSFEFADDIFWKSFLSKGFKANLINPFQLKISNWIEVCLVNQLLLSRWNSDWHCWQGDEAKAKNLHVKSIHNLQVTHRKLFSSLIDVNWTIIGWFIPDVIDISGLASKSKASSRKNAVKCYSGAKLILDTESNA